MKLLPPYVIAKMGICSSSAVQVEGVPSTTAIAAAQQGYQLPIQVEGLPHDMIEPVTFHSDTSDLKERVEATLACCEAKETAAQAA
ncbi:MAG TPA: hypothetical protein VKH37_10955, partial [Ferruginibacter sp.]|nr:hypothetical protein [Ferruginibacter sp.]